MRVVTGVLEAINTSTPQFQIIESLRLSEILKFTISKSPLFPSQASLTRRLQGFKTPSRYLSSNYPDEHSS